MPDELIVCPSCRHQLRAPTELLGQLVQCPQCRAMFTAWGLGPGSLPPMVSAAPTPTLGGEELARLQQRAYGALVIPGVGMLICSTLLLVLNLGMFWLFHFAGDAPVEQIVDAYAQLGVPIDVDSLRLTNLIKTAVALPVYLAGLIGGIHVLKLKRYWLALAGSILTAINIVDCPCCLAVMPLGIWSTIVLFRPDIRQAFV
ncbi:MAG: hypothetical protein NZ700_08590 [Gemmataceae bacterium]|nr:hypothetical protein [Gemmataceae bacterium]MDW8266344.1 hypothetical protein [Gemmataceae bacterium]